MHQQHDKSHGRSFSVSAALPIGRTRTPVRVRELVPSRTRRVNRRSLPISPGRHAVYLHVPGILSVDSVAIRIASRAEQYIAVELAETYAMVGPLEPEPVAQAKLLSPLSAPAPSGSRRLFVIRPGARRPRQRRVPDAAPSLGAYRSFPAAAGKPPRPFVMKSTAAAMAPSGPMGSA